MDEHDVTGTPTPQEPSGGAADTGSAQEASQAWRDVLTELDALGDAIGRWIKAAVSDEENRRRAAELTAAFEKLAAQVGETVRGAADSEVGQSFKEAADKTGEALKKAGEKLSEEAGPRIAAAFKSLSEKLRASAERIEQRAGAAAEGETAPGAGPEAAPGQQTAPGAVPEGPPRDR